jgi:hypothetical protein
MLIDGKQGKGQKTVIAAIIAIPLEGACLLGGRRFPVYQRPNRVSSDGVRATAKEDK